MKKTRAYLSLASAVLVLVLAAVLITACGGNGGNASDGGSDGHKHVEKVDPAVAPSCYASGLTEGKSCSECGEILTAQETVTPTGEHKYEDEWSTDSEYHYYMCSTPNCPCFSMRVTHTFMTDSSGKSFCTVCGYGNDGSLSHSASSEHTFEERAMVEYIVTPAADASGAVYCKSCICGAVSTETFSPSISSRMDYEPTSPTMTMYETAQKLSYGFTWNCSVKPNTPAVRIMSEDGEGYTYYPAQVTEYQSYDSNEEVFNFYVCKTVVELIPDKKYTYKIVDLCSGVGSDETELTAVNPNGDSFTFASFSDSQDSDGGAAFNTILKNMSDVDFYLHGGDICEDSKHEDNWKNMLDYSKEYLMAKPMMVTAGNHDTVYKSGSNELFKHFNNNIPAQESTVTGYFYSFEYCNAKFIVINTNVLFRNKELTQEQYSWLVNELKNNDKQWTIVSMHNPMYSGGAYGSDPSRNAIALGLRAQLTSLFAEYNVDIVIQGHDHVLCKTRPIDAEGYIVDFETEEIDGVECNINPGGVIYLVNSVAGSQARELSRYEGYLYEYAENGCSKTWAEYTVTNDLLKVEIKCSTGGQSVRVLHSWGIKK